MPIAADPEQLALIAKVLETYCLPRNIDRGSDVDEHLARRAICLYESGMRDPETMARTLHDASVTGSSSVVQRRRRVDKEKIERATREARVLIDAECAARKEKTERLRALRLISQSPGQTS